MIAPATGLHRIGRTMETHSNPVLLQKEGAMLFSA